MQNSPWDFIKVSVDIIATIVIPFVVWMFYTIFQHSKKLIMLEQKVNDSINMRLDNLENKFDSLDEKLDGVKDSILQNRLHMQESMNEKFGAVLEELRKKNNDD